MCQSQANGGVRCTYADQIANIRRKALYKHRKSYDAAREAEKAIRVWQEGNPDIVQAHLPASQPFQAAPNLKPIPKTLLSLFTAKSREPITGFPEQQRQEHTAKLFEENQQWMEALTQDEENVIRHYAMNLYELVNAYLRRGGLAKLYRENPFYKDREVKIPDQVSSLDSAITKAPIPEEPRKLFRFFRVPAGVTPNQYIERYFKTGEGFKDKGYMSTTADPEFIMAHMHNRNKGTKNHGYIVMEIITKQGASLQPRATSRSGNVQSLEKEIMLPRNMKMRIAGSRRSQRFEFASNRMELHQQYGNAGYNMSDDSYARWGKFKKGDHMNFPVIQMVDEKLISETR